MGGRIAKTGLSPVKHCARGSFFRGGGSPGLQTVAMPGTLPRSEFISVRSHKFPPQRDFQNGLIMLGRKVIKASPRHAAARG